jgi:hypothetical protein
VYQVIVEFEHAKEQRTPMVLHGGEYIGDMCLLGVQDWAGYIYNRYTYI